MSEILGNTKYEQFSSLDDLLHHPDLGEEYSGIINKIRELKEDISDENLLKILNKFLTQGLDFDEKTKNFLKSKVKGVKSKIRNKNKSKQIINDNYFFSKLSENLNYTVFDLVLNNIINDFSDILNIEIYQSSDFMDIHGHVDYQVVLSLKNGKKRIFGLDLKNHAKKFSSDNDISKKEEFNSQTLDINGEALNFGNNNFKPAKDLNSYQIFIEPSEEQLDLNKFLLLNNLEINKLQTLEQQFPTLIQNIEKYFREILKNEQKIATIGNADSLGDEVSLATKNLVDYLSELQEQRTKLLEMRKKEQYERKKREQNIVNNIKANIKNKLNNKSKPNIRAKIGEYITGTIELEKLLSLIGEENYAQYKAIGKMWDEREFLESGLVKIKISKSSTRSLSKPFFKRFEKLARIAKVKVIEKQISDLLKKDKLKVTQKLQILKLMQENFVDIFLKKEDFKSFNKHFSFNNLVSLPDNSTKKDLLLYLRFLKELDVDNEIKIKLDDIERIKLGNIKLGDYKSYKNNNLPTLRDLLKKKKTSLEEKFRIFQLFLDKKSFVEKNIEDISNIINLVAKNIKVSLLYAKGYSNLYKKNFLQIIGKLNNKVKKHGYKIDFNEIILDDGAKLSTIEDFLSFYEQKIDNKIKKEKKENYKKFVEMLNKNKKSINDKIDIIDYILEHDVDLKDSDFEGLNKFLDVAGLNRIKIINDSELKISKLELFQKIKKLKEKVDNSGEEKLKFTFPQIERFIIKFDVNKIVRILEKKNKMLQDRIDILNFYLSKESKKINGEDLENINFIINSAFQNKLAHMDSKENIEKKLEFYNLVEKIYEKIDRIEGMNLSFYKESENIITFLNKRKERLKN